MDLFNRFPRQIAVSSRPGAQTYAMVPNQHAVHGQPPEKPSPDAIHLLNEGTIGVFKGAPEPAVAKAGKVSPVYTLGPGGSPAVPTGLVFFRLAEGVLIGDRKAEIENAGYEVVELLAYAPNAAWLRARSGDIADALTGLGKLEKIPAVESVEPQMLIEGGRR